jgi:pyruvate kinase
MPQSLLKLEEPFRLDSILEPGPPGVFTTLTKIIGTLGPNSRSVEILEKLLKAGMSVARFDFTWGDDSFHQETLDNLKIAIKNTRRLCAIMLDSIGPELKILNESSESIELKEGSTVVLTPDKSKVASPDFLPINYSDLSYHVKSGDEIFVGQYLYTGSETTSVWLQVIDTNGPTINCLVKNTATLTGEFFTAVAAGVRIGLPTLSDIDKQAIQTWGVRNQIDFVSLSHTRHANDVHLTRGFLSKLGDLKQTHIYAKIENREGLEHFDEILKEADGIILSRGNLGIDIPAERVFVFQKAAIKKCNYAGKPIVITRVVDSMVDSPRPTRAEATDVANMVLDGADCIMFGAETYRGNYPVETCTTVRLICGEVEKVFNQSLYFKNTCKFVGEPMEYLETIASSAVKAAIKVKASVIVVFTSSGKAARLVSKYRPIMPVLVVVIPRLTTDKMRWTFTGATQARQCLITRGLFPMLADPRHPTDTSANTTNESILKVRYIIEKYKFYYLCILCNI